jgi:predicted Ser/Thr protein kinase
MRGFELLDVRSEGVRPAAVVVPDLPSELAPGPSWRGQSRRSRLCFARRRVDPAVLQVGSTVGDYRLEELIGRGGMGVVYRATQLSLGRPVAVKLIAPEVGDEPAFRERFKREARLAAQIDHPNVIPLYQADVEDGQLFIAMRYVEGTDLRALVTRQSRLEPNHASWLVAQIAAALDAAHGRGLVHRDVKPANVLLAGDFGAEHAYLTDFGLMKHTTSHDELTRSGAFVGTLDYAAPEQLRGWPVDARTDVYALGCLLYLLLTGQVPYPRENEAAKVWAHIADELPRPSETFPGVTLEFDEVVMRAMAKEPDARYTSAGDLGRAALAAAAGERAASAEQSVATGPAAPRGATGPPVPGSAAGLPHGPKRPSRRRVAIGALTVAFAGAVAAAVIALEAGGPSDDGTARPGIAAHQAAVGAICTEANMVQAARERRFDTHRRKLSAARTVAGQRNAILNETQLRLSASADLMARLDAEPPPSPDLAPVQGSTLRAWARNLRRLRSHRDALEDVGSHRELLRALNGLPRSAIETDATRVAAGLRRLGGSRCDLDPVVPDPVLRVRRIPPNTQPPARGGGGSSNPTPPQPSPTPPAPAPPAEPPPNPTPPPVIEG